MERYNIEFYAHFKNAKTHVSFIAVLSTLDELHEEEKRNKKRGYVCTKMEARCTKQISLFEEQIICSKEI